MFDSPQLVTQIATPSVDDITAMSRVLVKREILEHEKLARTVLEAGAFHPEERPTLVKLRTIGLSSIAIPDFNPPSPPGVAPATFIADLKDKADFRRTRGEEAEKAMLKAFPQLFEGDKGF